MRHFFVVHIIHRGTFLPFAILFATHISYQFILKTISNNVSEYNLYHCRANYVHPYMACNINIYRNFCPFSYLTFFLCSEFIWYIISTISSLDFNKTSLYFGISECNYASGTSKVVTSITSYAMITSVANKSSNKTVGDATLSPSLKYIFYLFPFVKVLPLMVPLIYLFMGFIASSVCLLSSYVSSLVFIVITKSFPGIYHSSNCFNYFIIADIVLSPNNFITFFAYICVNITFIAAYMY